MTKSGKRTEGLGWFYHGGSQKVASGLEMSTICIADLQLNTAYALDNQQTIDLASEDKEETRVDQYALQVMKTSSE